MEVHKNLKNIRIKSPEDIRRSAEAFRDIVKKLVNLRIAASHNIAKNEALVDIEGQLIATEVFGWEGKNDWLGSAYLALESPITMACRYESEPFWINEKGVYTQHPNTFLDEIDLSKFRERAKTNAAIVVPVHMPFSQIGAVSFNPFDEDTIDLSEAYDNFGMELGLYARAFIRSYMHVLPRVQILPSSSKLSKREVECLRWAAMGKTDIEISMIIKRSRATVRFHIHNASMKLDAVNRSQAVFKATQLGYISNMSSKILI